jgi:hypothetical protein
MHRIAACVVVASLSYVVSVSPVSAQIPTPTRVPLPRLADAGPERANALVAVSPGGFVAFTSGFDAAGRLVTVIDPTGTVVARLAKRGDGPGEFRMPLRLMFADSTLYVFEAARLAAFSHRGVLLWSRAMAPTDLPLAVRGDSMDAFSSPDPTRRLGLRRISLATMQGREILPLGSTPLHHLSRATADSTRTAVPGYAPLGTGFVLGSGARYELVAFDADGRATGPFGRRAPGRPRTGAALEAEITRRRAAADRPFRGPDGELRRIPVDEARIRREAGASVAWFIGRNGGLQTDDRGRVIAIVPGGDSAALEFFSGQRASGRVVIPCAGRAVTAASGGRFLALLCAPTDEADAEVELQLWSVR